MSTTLPRDRSPADDDSPVARDPLASLWQPGTIRARCAAIARAVDDGRSGWFTIDRNRMPDLARRVADLTRERFPDLRVPPHSRWRHFGAGGVDRAAELDAALAGRDAASAARARLDLTVISVLLDAGAGADWRYEERLGGAPDPLALPEHRQRRDDLLAMLEKASGGGAANPAPAPEPAAPAVAGQRYARSEGLAVATFRAFMAGTFSGDADDPLRVDGRVLTRLDAAALRAVFQSSPSNPVTGLEGRAELLRRLGGVLEQQALATGRPARPSHLFDHWLSTREPLHLGDLLSRLVSGWAPIWLHGSRVLGLPAGDVWPHLWAGDATPGGPDHTTGGWVPFHKLSQWLVYSLMEPLQAAGVPVVGQEALTGLPEYRNGGLLLDGGVIVPRDARDLAATWKPGDPIVVEWRALTLHLIDELALQVRHQLGLDATQLPLAAVLEGGTWAAGRVLAQERRGGAPPMRVDSDGTVF